jgi:dTDP-4-dehydrorhamnose 3,5-epimerase
MKIEDATWNAPILSKKLIDGVKIKKLRVVPDARGRLGEIFRSDDPDFEKFGQVYFTTTYSGVVKGWHLHMRQCDHFACIRGTMKVALFDVRESSSTTFWLNEFYIGEHNPCLVVVPPGIYHGWMCVSDKEAYIVNVPDKKYNYKKPDEIRVAPFGVINYNWNTGRNG